LRLSNLDCKIDTNGIVIILRGKTGERRVRIVSFVPLLQQWLEIHPLKDQKQFPLWISTATNNKNKPLGLKAGEYIIKEALHNAGLNDKRSRLYILRHSRASYLCQFLPEAQMCIFFGWQHGTKVVRRYIHISGKDLDNTLLSIGEGKPIIKEQEYQLKIIKCNRCSENLSPTMQFCSRCGLSNNLSHQYTKEFDEIKEIEDERINELERQIKILTESQKEILECLKYPDKLMKIT
jgi:integrase/recombinase XerD